MKKIISITISLVLILMLAVPSFAFTQFHDYNAPRVVDNADIFSDEVEEGLIETYKQWQTIYETDVVLVSTLDIEGNSIDDYTADYYDYNGYGIGDDYSGIIMCICMEPGNHCYSIITTGQEIERYYMSDIDSMYDNIDPYLADGDFDGAATAFTYMVGSMMANGNLYGADDTFENTFGESDFEYQDYSYQYEQRTNYFQCYFVAFIVAIIVAFAVVGGFKKQMTPVEIAVSARNYLVDGSFNLRNQTVMFLHSDITRTARPKESSSSSHGSGGGHSGVSHGGGGGRSF